MKPVTARKNIRKLVKATKEENTLTEDEKDELTAVAVLTFCEVLVGIWEELREANGKEE